MRIAEFDELRKLLIAQDIALIVIAGVLLAGMIALVISAGGHAGERNGRDIRDTPARKPQTRRGPL